MNIEGIENFVSALMGADESIEDRVKMRSMVHAAKGSANYNNARAFSERLAAQHIGSMIDDPTLDPDMRRQLILQMHADNNPFVTTDGVVMDTVRGNIYDGNLYRRSMSKSVTDASNQRNEWIDKALSQPMTQGEFRTAVGAYFGEHNPISTTDGTYYNTFTGGSSDANVARHGDYQKAIAEGDLVDTKNYQLRRAGGKVPGSRFPAWAQGVYGTQPPVAGSSGNFFVPATGEYAVPPNPMQSVQHLLGDHLGTFDPNTGQYTPVVDPDIEAMMRGAGPLPPPKGAQPGGDPAPEQAAGIANGGDLIQAIIENPMLLQGIKDPSVRERLKFALELYQMK